MRYVSADQEAVALANRSPALIGSGLSLGGLSLCGLSLSGLSLCGCLLPVPINAPPAEVNYPPFQDPTQVDPSPARTVTYDPETGDALVFRTGPLDDPNEDDRLFWRWFFNYQPSANYVLVFEEGAAEGRSPDQLLNGLEFPLNPCPFPPPFSSPEPVERVDLIVSDRPFVDSLDEPPGTPNPNQVLPEDARAFRLTWFVLIDRGKCP